MEIVRRCIRDILTYWNQCRGLIMISVALVCFFTVGIRVLQKKVGLEKEDLRIFLCKLFLYVCDSIYLTYTFYVTFGMRYVGLRREIKWIPFEGVWTSPWEIPLLVENILLFIPFGVLLPLTFAKLRNWKATLGSAGVCSMLIEILQYVFKCGKTEVDDCILNCLGGLIGYGMLCIMRGVRNKTEKKSAEY